MKKCKKRNGERDEVMREKDMNTKKTARHMLLYSKMLKKKWYRRQKKQITAQENLFVFYSVFSVVFDGNMNGKYSFHLYIRVCEFIFTVHLYVIPYYVSQQPNKHYTMSHKKKNNQLYAITLNCATILTKRREHFKVCVWTRKGRIRVETKLERVRWEGWEFQFISQCRTSPSHQHVSDDRR